MADPGVQQTVRVVERLDRQPRVALLQRELALDDDANCRMVAGNAGLISKGERPVAAVVNTNEEWMIARDTAELAGLTRPAVTVPG